MACTEQKLQQDMEPFPEEKLLYAERIRVDEIINPEQMVLKKQSILVTDSRNHDAMLYQYSLPEFKCVYKGGVKGQAEDEFQVYPRIWRTLTDKVYIGGYTEFSLKSFGWITRTIFPLKKNTNCLFPVIFLMIDI